MYPHAQSSVFLAPVYELVTTTVLQPGALLALTLCGTKRWPHLRTLITFACSHCEMSEARTRRALAEVAHGLQMAQQDMALHMAHTPRYKEIGQMVLAQWAQGNSTSLQG